MKFSKVLAAIASLCLVCGGAVSCASSGSSSSKKIKASNVDLNGDIGSTKAASSSEENTEAYDEEETKPAEPETEKETEAPTEPPTEAAPETYESNSLFDVTERGIFDSYGYTVIIDKVTAKKTGWVDSTVIAKGPDGKVIGKEEDSIYITAGEKNYFRYGFSEDISNASFDITTKEVDDWFSNSRGDYGAVEVVDWNISGNYLYVTLKQVKENIGDWAEIKFLYYKNGQIVGGGTLSIDFEAENLDGVGSTDVAEISAYSKDFDSIEFFYEP